MSDQPRRILIIGDNRRNVNWGGRGASIALSQVLGRRFHVAERIGGEAFHFETCGFGYVGTLLPPQRANWYYYALKHADSRALYRWYTKLEQACGAHDVIQSNPLASAREMLALESRYPFLQSMCSAIRASDLVVVNGEGDFVLTSPPRREALFMLAAIEMCALLGTPVAFANALVSDCPTTGRNLDTLAAMRTTLAKCRAVCVRDASSLEFMRTNLPEIACQMVPDSLFTWAPILSRSREQLPINGDFTIPYPEQEEQFGKLRFDRDYVCVGGSAAAGLHPEQSAAAYSALVRRLLAEGMRVILVQADGRDEFLATVARDTATPMIAATTPILMAGAVLANARLLISGRYHAAILAALGGTPSILLKTTAHKMESLGALLGLPESACFTTLPAVADHDALINAARELMAGDAWRPKIAAETSRLCSDAERLPDILDAALKQS